MDNSADLRALHNVSTGEAPDGGDEKCSVTGGGAGDACVPLEGRSGAGAVGPLGEAVAAVGEVGGGGGVMVGQHVMVFDRNRCATPACCSCARGYYRKKERKQKEPPARSQMAHGLSTKKKVN